MHEQLGETLENNKDVTRRLRALWALHVTGGLDEKLLGKLLSDRDEYIRAWAIQLEAEDDAVAVLGLYTEYAARRHDRVIDPRNSSICAGKHEIV